jgi:drug/metabolite transporter (DMT)-like permease
VLVEHVPPREIPLSKLPTLTRSVAVPRTPIDLAPRLFEGPARARTRPLRLVTDPTTARTFRLPPTPRLSGRTVPHGAKIAAALLTVYVVWGSTFLANGIAVTTIPPFLMMTARFSIAGGLLFVVAIRAASRWPTWRQWRDATITGCMLLVGGTGLVTAAQVHLGSGTAALLCATVPLWLALMARLRFGEKLSGRAWLGLAIGLAGVAALVDPSGGRVVPTLVVLAGSASWAAGTLHSRGADAAEEPLVAASMEMLGAALGFLIVGLAIGEAGRFSVADLDTGSLVALGYLVTAGSIVAFTAYSWLLRNASTVLVGSYAYVNPVVAVLLGWAFAGELVTGRTLVGGAIVLASVVLLVTGRPDQPVPAQPTSGGDVFAGQRRWHRAYRRLGALPSAARLYVRPGAPTYRPVRRDRDVV